MTNTPPSGYTYAAGIVNYVANNQYTSLSNKTVYPFLSSLFEVGGIKYVPVSPSERTCDAIDCIYDASATQINIGELVSYKGVAMKVMSVNPYTCYDNTYIIKVSLSFNGNIGNYAFNGCKTLQSATVSNNGYIGKSAFYGCTGLKNATINNNGYIGESAFENCTGSNPARFEISNVGDIYSRAFYGCTGLQTVTLGNEIPSIGNSAFYNCSSLQSIVIPDAVTVIGNNAFQNCGSMEFAKIGNGASAIPQYAFSGCSALTTVQMGKKVETIDTYAFSNCTSLTDVKMGENTKTLGMYSFQNCSSLPIIEIPKSVTIINNYAFSGCSTLATVIMKDREDDTALSLGSNGSSPIFADCPLDSVYIGRNISYGTSSSYGYSPFYRNISLRSVTITNKETEISPNEFYGCTNLKNVRIGNGVTTIGNWAFSGCSSLDFFAFGTAVKDIGQEAFSDCTAMTKLISLAETPPTCKSQALDDINKWSCTLYIPQNSESAYRAADQWKEFFFMEVTTGIKAVETDIEEAEVVARYDANGRRITSCRPGLNILKMSDGTIRKVFVK